MITWKDTTVKNVAELVSGGTPSRKDSRFWGGQIPWITCKDMKADRLGDSSERLTEAGLEARSRLVPAGAVLIVIRGMILARDVPVALATRPVSFNQDLKALLPKPGINGEFLLYALKSKVRDLQQMTARAAHGTKSLLTSNIADLSIPLPALDEQRRIAAVLSAVQGAIERQERLIALSSELKKALMHKLFTEGTRGEPLKQTEIGPVPESWTVTRLGELCKKPAGRIQTGPFGSILHKSEYQNAGTPIVNPVHLIDNHIDPTGIPRIGEAAAERLHRYRLKENDLLFGRRGDIGRHAIVTYHEVSWFCGTGCFIVRVSDPRINASFLNAYLSKDEVVTWLERHATGVIMPNLSNKVLERIPICLPSSQEQLAIAAALRRLGDSAKRHPRIRGQRPHCDAYSARSSIDL